MPQVRVVFTYDDGEGGGRPDGDEMWVPLSRYRSRDVQVTRDGVATTEREGPWASNLTPFEGELDEQEIDRLTGRRPIHQHWVFEVTPITGGAV